MCYHRIYLYETFEHITLKVLVQKPAKNDQKFCNLGQLMLKIYKMRTFSCISLKLCSDMYYHKIYVYERFERITLKISVQKAAKKMTNNFVI